MSGEPCRIPPNVTIIKGQVLYIIFFGMPNIFLIIIFFFFFFFLKKTRLQFSIQGYWCLPFAVSDYPQPPRSPQWCFNRPLTTFMVLKQMTSTKNTFLWRAGCGSGVDFSTLDDSVRFHHSIMWMNLYACLCTFLMMWYEGFFFFFFKCSVKTKCPAFFMSGRVWKAFFRPWYYSEYYSFQCLSPFCLRS